MEVLERIKTLEKFEDISREELANRAGIKYTRLRNAIGGQTKLRHEEVEAIGKAFPEYKLWLAYGEEMPEAGQISPMTKKTQMDYQKPGQAG